jgi:cephalosporin hydroxylase
LKPWHHPEVIAREIRAFADLIKQEGAKSYLEIGSKYGGSLWGILSNVEPMRVVSVDLQVHGDALFDCVCDLLYLRHEITLIRGNSRDAAVIEQVYSRGPYDVVYIDGDHSLEGVTADWIHYGPMGKMVAFHDIADQHGMEVPKLWAELKPRYRHKEIIMDSGRCNYGIGILWRD